MCLALLKHIQQSASHSSNFLNRVGFHCWSGLSNLFRGHLRRRLEDNAIKSLAWHSARPFIVSEGKDQALRIWNVDAGELLLEVYGMTVAITRIRFSPDGSRIGASTQDPERRLRIWDFDGLLEGIASWDRIAGLHDGGIPGIDVTEVRASKAQPE